MVENNAPKPILSRLAKPFVRQSDPPPIPVEDHEANDPLFVPLAPEEQNKIREQQRASRLERRLLGDEKFVDFAHDATLIRLSAASTSAQNTIRMSFLANAGSLVALLTFIGTLYSRSDASSFPAIRDLANHASGGMLYFSYGLFASLFSALFFYFEQTFHAIVAITPSNARRLLLKYPKYSTLGSSYFGWIVSFFIFGISLALSMMFWLAGLINILEAFQALDLSKKVILNP